MTSKTQHERRTSFPLVHGLAVLLVLHSQSQSTPVTRFWNVKFSSASRPPPNRSIDPSLYVSHRSHLQTSRTVIIHVTGRSSPSGLAVILRSHYQLMSPSQQERNVKPFVVDAVCANQFDRHDRILNASENIYRQESRMVVYTSKTKIGVSAIRII